MMDPAENEDNFLLWRSGEPLRPDEAAERLRTEGELTVQVATDHMAPLIEPGDLIRVLPAPGEPRGIRRGQIVLFRTEQDFALAMRTRRRRPEGGEWVTLGGDGVGRPGDLRQFKEPLGVVATIDKGEFVASLEDGFWRAVNRGIAHLPLSSRGVGLLHGGLLLLRKILHPFHPPVSLGDPESLARMVVEAYNGPEEVQTWASAVEEGLNEAERLLLGKYMGGGGRILDVGCGAGREAIAWARLGYRVTGIDTAPRMIERAGDNARRTGVNITFTVADPASFEAPPGSFDYVIFSPYVYSYIASRRRRIATLIHLRDLLAPRGILVLSAVCRVDRRNLLSRSLLVDTLRRGIRAVGGERFTSEPGDMLDRVPGGSAPSFTHIFMGRQEAAAEIEAAGYRLSFDEAGDFWVAARR